MRDRILTVRVLSTADLKRIERLTALVSQSNQTVDPVNSNSLAMEAIVPKELADIATQFTTAFSQIEFTKDAPQEEVIERVAATMRKNEQMIDETFIMNLDLMAKIWENCVPFFPASEQFWVSQQHKIFQSYLSAAVYLHEEYLIKINQDECIDYINQFQSDGVNSICDVVGEFKMAELGNDKLNKKRELWVKDVSLLISQAKQEMKGDIKVQLENINDIKKLLLAELEDFHDSLQRNNVDTGSLQSCITNLQKMKPLLLDINVEKRQIAELENLRNEMKMKREDARNFEAYLRFLKIYMSLPGAEQNNETNIDFPVWSLQVHTIQAFLQNYYPDVYKTHFAAKNDDADAAFKQYQNKLKADVLNTHRQRKADALDAQFIAAMKKKLDVIIEKVDTKATKLEQRAAVNLRLGKIEDAKNDGDDAMHARDLAQGLRGQSRRLGNLPKLKQEKIDVIANVALTCQRQIDDTSQTSLATRSPNWWGMIAKNVLGWVLVVGLAVSAVRWLAGHDFLMFNKRKSANLIKTAEDAVKGFDKTLKKLK